MPTTYDDVETLVRARHLAEQIERELETTTTLVRPVLYPFPFSPPPPPPSIEPEAFVPAPSLPPSDIYETDWSSLPPLLPSRRTTKKRRIQRTKSRLHWLVLAAAAAIAVGLWRDPTARTNAKRQLSAETQKVVKAAAVHAKRVSARII